ncbi:Aminomethyltransferase [Burkholderia lata]|uniref:Aminomethyltransferase n=1 Tax=Burkholderia lata (strain ATCC 17760 / DSM 23089 / LMG 22485 / NCIMB 9086 / R18194 / 383) TaxID=482957 RepID=A0A6P2VA73_BURL3|nr:aminomethyl transferase family protein [Burkholderia lata]VWC77126.1 Aminomethyltransferase [Burkholderia lata]
MNSNINRGAESLQDLLDRQPNLVDYFYNDVRSPHFSSSGSGHLPAAFTNWRDEQRGWGETAVLFDQTFHMPVLNVRGPDAARLIERLSVATMSNFTTDRAKQFIAVTPRGHSIGDSIIYRHAEDHFELISGKPALNWVAFNAETGGFNVSVEWDLSSNQNKSGRRNKFRFQLDGPNAGEIFASVLGGKTPELGFFRTTHVTIKGQDVLVLRHGMAGHAGVELSGPYEAYEAIRDALLEAGAPYDMRRVGNLAYFSTPLSNAWPAYPVPGIYTGDELTAYRRWLSADDWEARSEIGGSFISSNIEDYYVDPYDLGYGRVVKFDHDFIGREALESISEEKRRTKRMLVWNHDDVQKVYASQLGDGPRYKSLDFPIGNYAWKQFDELRNVKTGEFAGVSAHCGYVAPDKQVLSIAFLQGASADPGTEVVLTWGEPNGGSRKPQVERHEQTTIRATVVEAPYSRDVQEQIRSAVHSR